MRALSSRNLYHVTTTVDTGVEAIYLSEINDHDWCLAQSQVKVSLGVIKDILDQTLIQRHRQEDQ